MDTHPAAPPATVSSIRHSTSDSEAVNRRLGIVALFLGLVSPLHSPPPHHHLSYTAGSIESRAAGHVFQRANGSVRSTAHIAAHCPARDASLPCPKRAAHSELRKGERSEIEELQIWHSTAQAGPTPATPVEASSCPPLLDAPQPISP